MCDARLGEYNFSATGSWRSTMRSTADVVRGSCRNEYVSKIFSTPGLDLSYILPDWMHTVDLGILLYTCGCCLWDLVERMGGTFNRPQPAIAQIMNLIRIKSRELGQDPPFHSLTVTMIRSVASKPPRLRVKAGEARHFLPVLLAMLRDYFPAESAYEQCRFHCLAALNRCFAELANWQDGPGGSARRLELAALQHLQLYQRLHELRADPLMWRLYPKHHLFQHCSTNAWTNPVLLWNYSDEDCIGEAVRIARGCNVAHLHTAVIRRYRLLI